MFDRRLAAEVADGFVSRARQRITDVGLDVSQQPLLAIALVDACQELLTVSNSSVLNLRSAANDVLDAWDSGRLQDESDWRKVEALRRVVRPAETPQNRAGAPEGQTPTDPSEHPVSLDLPPLSLVDSPAEGLPDTELPGMWSNSDFEGETESYVNCPNCNAQARLYPDPNTRLKCNNCGYTEDGHA